MFSRTNKPYFARSGQKQKEKDRQSKQSLLLILILKRIVKRNMKNYFDEARNYGKSNERIMNKFLKIVEKNSLQAKIVYWKQLKYRTKMEKRNSRILLKILGFNKKYENYVKKEVFSVLLTKRRQVERRESQGLRKVRQFIMVKLLKRLEKQKLQSSFRKLSQHKSYSRNQEKYMKGLSFLFSKLKNKTLSFAFMKILNYGSHHYQNTAKSLSGLKKKVQELDKQLSKKSVKYQQIQHKDQIQSKGSKKRSSSQTTRKVLNSKRSMSSERDEKKSDNGNFSVMSMLNGSFFTLKSGRSSGKDSVNGGECYCKYREKYNHYKCESISLKNQVQIMEKELQVTKDLNEHLQGQFNEFFCSEENNEEIQRLKKQIKELKKDRQNLREKITKYQKYISNLKYQFKLKMENLYRNVKKNN